MLRLPAIDRLTARLPRARIGHRFGAAILMYHAVGDWSADPWALSVTPEHFAEQLKALRASRVAMSLRDLVGSLREGSLDRRAVVLTFDDGYANNLERAKPLLERYEVPATVFVATGRLGSRREFWWDELDRVLLQPGELPRRLELPVGDVEFVWDLGADARYPAETARRHRTWRADGRVLPTLRQGLYAALYRRLFPLSERERRPILDALVAWSGCGLAPRETHRPLGADELRDLARGGLIEIGAHTVDHPTLAAISPELQAREISGSKAALEAVLGAPVESFAYPFGGQTDYGDETVGFVKEAGFSCACTTSPRPVSRRGDSYRLPRFQVLDSDGARLPRLVA